MCQKAYLSIALLILTVSFAYAITDKEQFRALNLKLRIPGARASGMGGAFIGLADDTTASETNPAGLARIEHSEISVDFAHSPTRDFDTRITNLPVTNFDPDPTLPPIAPGEPVLATFTANHSINDSNSIAFAGTTVRLPGFTFAVSRSVRMDSEMSLTGGATASPFHFVEPNEFAGSARIRVVNYIFSIAKGGSAFSAGAGLKIANLDYETSFGARQKQQTNFGEHFTIDIDQLDQEVGFNAGILLHPGNRFSLGLVYNFEPEFEMQTLVNNVDNNLPFVATRRVKFNVPDSMGIGVSLVPFSNFTLNFDVVRWRYSQFDPVDVGFSIFTHVLPEGNQEGEIFLQVEDQTDYHLGGEFRKSFETGAVAFRAGWYRQGSNRTFLAIAARPGVLAFLRPIYGDDHPDSITHYTLGAGVGGRHFQFDVALDFSKQQEVDENFGQLIRKTELTEGGTEIILSSTVKF